MDSIVKNIILFDLANLSTGYPVRGSVEQLPLGDVAMVQMRDVDAGQGIGWHSVVRVRLPGKRLPDFLNASDVVFTTRGLRNAAVVVGEVPVAAVCAPNLFVIRLRGQNICLPQYLAWYINQKPAQAYFQRESTGTSIQNIRREVLERLMVPVPPIEQQRKIVIFNKAARHERDLLEKLIQNTEQHMEALAIKLAGRELA